MIFDDPAAVSVGSDFFLWKPGTNIMQYGKLTCILACRFDKGSAIAGLKGSDNIISFYTKRYGERALIIQGAG